MSIMAKTPSGYKKIGSAYLGERPVDKVFNANGDVVYALQRELTGVPPLLFKGKEQSELLNYRIYGDTVDGESVGDRTANLIQGSIKNANIGNNGKINTSNEFFLVYAPVVTGESYTISNNNGTNVYAFYNVVPSTGTETSYDNNRQIFSTSTITFVSPTTGYIAVRLANTAQDIMINPGSTAVPYEPVGYRVPVTVEGKNLFDGELLRGYWAISDGNFNFTGTWVCTNKFKCKPSTTYTFSFNTLSRWYGFVWYDSNGTYISSSFSQESTIQTLPIIHTATSPANAAYFAADIGSYPSNSYTILPTDVTDLMLNEGTTPLPYEPYHAPVTTPIYLPEPIKMVGDEAEYIDYGEQKQHRVRKNLWSGVVEQGSVSTVGVYADSTKRVRSRNIPIEPGAYTFSANLLIRVIYAYNDDNKIGVCIDAPLGTYSRSFTVPTGANNISIGMMKIVNNVEVDITPSDFTWGQIEKGSEATIYEPYIENTDLDVTLPALPTLTGTNQMGVDTEIQPSRMDIKGRIKSLT